MPGAAAAVWRTRDARRHRGTGSARRPAAGERLPGRPPRGDGASTRSTQSASTSGRAAASSTARPTRVAPGSRSPSTCPTSGRSTPPSSTADRLATVHLPRSLIACSPAGRPGARRSRARQSRDVIDELDRRWPGMRDRLCEAGPADPRAHQRVRRWRPGGASTPVGPGPWSTSSRPSRGAEAGAPAEGRRLDVGDRGGPGRGLLLPETHVSEEWTNRSRLIAPGGSASRSVLSAATGLPFVDPAGGHHVRYVRRRQQRPAPSGRRAGRAAASSTVTRPTRSGGAS